jgi:hypothetical protein
MVPAIKYLEFMKGLFEATGDRGVVEAAETFRALCEGNFFRPLMVPDSVRQNAVIDWKGFTHVVPNAANTSGTSAPDVLPDGGVSVSGHCTRDIGEETRNAKWNVPDLISGGQVTGLNKYKSAALQSVPIDQMIKRAKEHLPNPMQWNLNLTRMPMQCGYSVTCPNNQNGVYAGDGAGGGGGDGGAGAGAAS